MAKPVLVVVDDDDASLQALVRELESRYAAHYRIVSSRSAEEAFARLEELRIEGTSVPLILADPGEEHRPAAPMDGVVSEEAMLASRPYPRCRALLGGV